MKVLMPGLRVGILQGDIAQTKTEILHKKDPTLPELKAMAKEAGLKVSGTKDEIIARLTEANIKIKDDAEEIQYDCTICMIQTLCGKEYNDLMFKEYGFTIFDECHHLGAQHFSKTLQKVQTKCMLGLSATPKREDGLTKVFFWFLGQPVYWEKQREPDPTVEVVSVLIKSDEVDYNTIPTDWRGETVMARLLTNVLGCSERTDEIVRRIVELCSDSHRRVLVLSERIGHLEEIERRLEPQHLKISYYIGGMKEAVREEGARDAQVLLASYAMASEAMNIKTLNTVILASPRKHVEQSTGRILRVRTSERTVVPKIIDIVDIHPMYRGQWKKRLTYYRACAYSLKTVTGGEEEVTVVEQPTTEPDQNGCLIQD
jgi:superfamily II DNA or RNA helicase